MNTQNGRPQGGEGTGRQDVAALSSVRHEQLRVFDWLDAVAAAIEGRSKSQVGLLRTAMTLVRGGKALTGQHIAIDEDHIAQVLDVDPRTVRRYCEQLVALGFLRQTQKPAPGVSARYELTGPKVFDRRTRTVDNTTPENVHRTVDNTTPENVHRSQGQTEDNSDREPVHRSIHNGGQKQGVTVDTVTPGNVRHKPREPISPPTQPTTWPPADDAHGNGWEGKSTQQDIDYVLGEYGKFAKGHPVQSCSTAINHQLARGWRPEDIVDAVKARGSIDGVTSPPAVLRRRTEDLGLPPRALPPKCDACDANRMVETTDGRPKRCPTCHPQATAQKLDAHR